jgi:hypothetical protein
MTPLEAARKMMQQGPAFRYDNEYLTCVFCGAEIEELPPTEYGYPGHPAEPHEDDCPWLLMPQIVAALES